MYKEINEKLGELYIKEETTRDDENEAFQNRSDYDMTNNAIEVLEEVQQKIEKSKSENTVYIAYTFFKGNMESTEKGTLEELRETIEADFELPMSAFTFDEGEECYKYGEYSIYIEEHMFIDNVKFEESEA